MMKGNYYATKIISFITRMPIFVTAIGLLLFGLNFYISLPTLQSNKFYYRIRKPVNEERFWIIDVKGNEKWLPYVKIAFIILSLIACFLAAKWIYEMVYRKVVNIKKPRKVSGESDINVPEFPFNRDKMQFIIGLEHDRKSLDEVNDPKWVCMPELGLFQDIVIIGGKGMGKSQGLMYPFSSQILNYKAFDKDNKAGALILDVKGNFYERIVDIAKGCNRSDDLVIIELGGQYKYNPLYKPGLESLVLAKRIRLILDMFAGKGSNEAYWLDTAETIIDNAIKLARLRYGYFTFTEINKISNSEEFFKNTIAEVREAIENEEITLTDEQLFDLDAVENYYIYEYSEIKPETKAIFNSEISRMIRPFVSNYKAVKTFCCSKDELNFLGFEELIQKGKIVILKMDWASYQDLAKIIAAYLKLDFQTEVLSRLAKPHMSRRPLTFICDEYHIFVTSNDYDFYSLSREARCCNIVATQSYSSLLENLHSIEKVRVLMTNLKNKVFLQTDDKLTIDEAKTLFGKDEKKRERISISEGTDHNGKYMPVFNKVASKKGTSFNKSISYDTYMDFKFSEEDFTTKLRRFKALSFLSDGDKVFYIGYLHLIPFYSSPVYQKLLQGEG